MAVLRVQFQRSRWRWMLVVLIVGAFALRIARAARADKALALAVVTSQLEFNRQGNALNECLVKSPTKNTSCTRRNSLLLAKLADRHMKFISSVMHGKETECVRTVAQMQIAYLKLWRDGAPLLYRSRRKQAKRLFVKSLKISTAQDRLHRAASRRFSLDLDPERPFANSA